MEKKRYTDNRENIFAIMIPAENDPTLIVCPECSAKAMVTLNKEQPETGYSVKAVCSQCGFINDKKLTKKSDNFEPSDGFLGYPLWLKVSCCGHSLWAYNNRHLALLEDFVSAELRQHSHNEYGYSNSAITSRLPGWIKSAKNREKVLTCINKLKNMATVNN